MNPAVRVLLVEDDDDDFLLVRDWLAETTDPPFVLERAATYEAGLLAMERNEHDVYLVDYRLGKRNGLELLRAAVNVACSGPAILLTGKGDRGVDVEAMKAGAVDYLPKSQLTSFSLERAIRYAIERRHADAVLRQAQKMEAVGKLAGGVAHDFNNLLTIITGNTELLLAHLNGDHVARKLAAEVQKASSRAAGLTQRLLGFSRKQIITLKVLDLNAVVSDLGLMLRRLIGEDVELVSDLDFVPGRIRADLNQIEQVVVNLAVNARDAMPSGGTLRIQTRKLELDAHPSWAHYKVQPGRYLKLSVSDTGVGMTEEIKAHLFEPFFTTKDVGKGTGLGLATVYGIVKQNNGYVTVQSKVGHGTTVEIYLPSVEAAASSNEASFAAEPLTPGRGTILLVEDELAVRQLFALVLKQSGYQILEAPNGVEADRMADQHSGPIDLVVTDVVMPQMGGPELMDRLTKSRPQTKVLFLSGYTEDDLVRQVITDDAVAFLQKPFSVHTLAQKVGAILGQSTLDSGLPAVDQKKT